MSLAFSSSDSQVIERQIPIERRAEKIGENLLAEVYELPRCIDWINSNNFKHVALQFPNEMLVNCTAISLELQKQSECNIYILGDTSYGSCCVDEVAAEHVNAAGIIHFGHACLSPTNRLPVLYIFTHQPADASCIAEAFETLLLDKETPIIVMYDVLYSHVIGQLIDELPKDYTNIIFSQPNLPSKCTAKENPEDQQTNVNLINTTNSITKCGRIFEISENLSLKDYSIFYIGFESHDLINLMMTFNYCKFFTFNPISNTGRRETLDVNRQLRKRYYMIEKAKDAQIIGILVGTLGISNYLSVIKHLKELIKQSGKKPYTFVIGKLNAVKMANFMEVDVFVLVACPESSLIDSKEFLRPVITPFELEIACNQAREWTGDYITDFQELLPGAAFYKPSEIRENEEGDVSLISGKMRSQHLQNQDDSITEGADSSVVVRDNMAISSLHAEAAGEYLANRSWKGLEQNLGQTPAAAIAPGKKGIAIEYEEEGQ